MLRKPIVLRTTYGIAAKPNRQLDAVAAPVR